MYREKGYLELDDVKNAIPLEERLEKGPVAIIECVENIPCNPCKDSCPKKAIYFDADVCSKPKLLSELCNGCGMCVIACPGLAIFVVDKYYNDSLSSVTIPYEMLPQMEKGSKVRLFNRKGLDICSGIVNKVFYPKNKKVGSITVLVPRKQCMEVRYAKLESIVKKEEENVR